MEISTLASGRRKVRRVNLVAHLLLPTSAMVACLRSTLPLVVWNFWARHAGMETARGQVITRSIGPSNASEERGSAYSETAQVVGELYTSLNGLLSIQLSGRIEEWDRDCRWQSRVDT